MHEALNSNPSTTLKHTQKRLSCLTLELIIPFHHQNILKKEMAKSDVEKESSLMENEHCLSALCVSQHKALWGSLLAHAVGSWSLLGSSLVPGIRNL
jgi:hypothetical protein